MLSPGPLVRRTIVFARMIKFSHTVFALPFALTAVVLASRRHPITVETILWILLAMAGARSAAMGFNRIVDAEYDRRNPRTASREIPRGAVTTRQAAVFVAAAAAVLVLASYQLNSLCFVLSPLALAIIFFYSFTKRFTFLSHVFLGLALGVAPLGAWIAVAGEWNWAAFTLGLAVLMWVAGFDVIYACQDVEFDRREGLFSLPAALGIGAALWISRSLHAASFLFLMGIGLVFGLGTIYYVGVLLVGMVLLYEQSLVRADDLSKVNLAFFNMNGFISMLYLAATTIDVWLSF
jgi:4-hydroxybenzoate polyprenyltransferase